MGFALLGRWPISDFVVRDWHWSWNSSLCGAHMNSSWWGIPIDDIGLENRVFLMLQYPSSLLWWEERL